MFAFYDVKPDIILNVPYLNVNTNVSLKEYLLLCSTEESDTSLNDSWPQNESIHVFMNCPLIPFH